MRQLRLMRQLRYGHRISEPTHATDGRSESHYDQSIYLDINVEWDNEQKKQIDTDNGRKQEHVTWRNSI